MKPPPRHRPRRSTRTSRRGVGLIELLISLSILVIGMGAFLKSLLTSTEVQQDRQEQAVAIEAARSVLDAVLDLPPAVAFATYNSVPGDDPLGAGTAPGSDFLVWPLMPLEVDGDGQPGRVQFPSMRTNPGVLTELAGETDFRSPSRDLNGDGDAIDADVTADVILLPVIVEVEWTTISGKIQRVRLKSIGASL